MSESALKVLIVSENVSMVMGGESSLPFYYAKLLAARGAVVWIACHERVRSEVLERFPELDGRIVFVEDSRIQRAIFKYSAWLPYRIRDLIVGQLIHISTQRRLRNAALELARSGDIEVVLEPSPITPKGLSFMFGLGVPVVIGPLCGGMEFPPAFRHLDSWTTRLAIRAGRVLSQIANRIVPGKLEADVLLVANAQTQRALPRGVRGKVIRIFESGVDLHIWRPGPIEHDARGEVRFVFSGRFVDWKGIQYLIPAFEIAARRDANCVLELIGGGGELEHRVRALASAPALRGRIRLHGWLPRQRAAEILRSADVFVMPSLRECGGTAILEAMALGKAVITTDWGGPADYVNASCGILVRPTNETEFIDGLAEAIIMLSQSPHMRERLGRGGMQRVLQDYLTWDAKADRVMEILVSVTTPQR